MPAAEWFLRRALCVRGRGRMLLHIPAFRNTFTIFPRTLNDLQNLCLTNCVEYVILLFVFGGIQGLERPEIYFKEV